MTLIIINVMYVGTYILQYIWDNCKNSIFIFSNFRLRLEVCFYAIEPYL